MPRLVTFFDEQGKPIKMFGTAQDITHQHTTQLTLEQLVQMRMEELTATNEELIAANQLLARSNDNLEKFAFIASHDLQEPLRKVQAFGDIIKKQYGQQLGEGVSLLECMQSAASRMSMLIKDLLAFSRISTRKEISEAVSLNQVVAGIGKAICEKIVVNHGGAISATSQPDQRAIFTVFLPAS